MQLSLLEILWITIVSMGIVFVMLTILMFLMQGSSKIIQILEAKSHPTAGVVGNPVNMATDTPKDNGTLFETNKLAQVAALVALTKASADVPDKHFEIVSIEKKVD